MPAMTISLPKSLGSFVEARAAREGYGSVDECVHALLRETQRRQAKPELEAKLLEAIESGPAEPMTREDWESIEGEGMARLKGEAPLP
jgi:putative addiction module CopG family antidote